MEEQPRYKNDILAERESQWGDPTLTHARIAEVWSGLLRDKLKPGEDIFSWEVALMMVGMKAVRAMVNPEEKDSAVDMQGYAELSHIIFTEETKNE